MNIIKVIATLIIIAIAIIAVMLVLGMVETTAARDASLKIIAVLAIVGGAAMLIDQIKK